MKKWALWFFLIGVLGLSLIWYFTRADHEPKPYSELVISQGADLAVKTSIGIMHFRAGEKLMRSYDWKDCHIESNLRPREQRWYGLLGAYDPGGDRFAFGGMFKKSCEKVKGTIVEEGQLHFADFQGVYEWLKRQPAEITSHWTSDGLYVSWFLHPEDKVLDIGVFQFCIDGKRATTRMGAQDDRFKWNRPSARLKCNHVNVEVINQPKWKP